MLLLLFVLGGTLSSFHRFIVNVFLQSEVTTPMSRFEPESSDSQYWCEVINPTTPPGGGGVVKNLGNFTT